MALFFNLEKELFAVSALSFDKLILLFEKSFWILLPLLYFNSLLFGSVWIKLFKLILNILLHWGQVQLKL